MSQPGMPKPDEMAVGRSRVRALNPVEAVDATVELLELVRRAADREPEAFEAIYRMYYRRIHAYAAARLRSTEEAAEVAQECMVAAWRGLPTFRPQHERAFDAWLFRIARNTTIDRARRHGREMSTDDLPLGDVVVEFEDGVLGGHELARLLDQLSDDQRDVLILRFVLDLPLAEVAAITGKSEKAVSALQLRGLERLRKRVTR